MTFVSASCKLQWRKWCRFWRDATDLAGLHRGDKVFWLNHLRVDRADVWSSSQCRYSDLEFQFAFVAHLLPYFFCFCLSLWTDQTPFLRMPIPNNWTLIARCVQAPGGPKMPDYRRVEETAKRGVQLAAVFFRMKNDGLEYVCGYCVAIVSQYICTFKFFTTSRI